MVNIIYIYIYTYLHTAQSSTGHLLLECSQGHMTSHVRMPSFQWKQRRSSCKVDSQTPTHMDIWSTPSHITLYIYTYGYILYIYIYIWIYIYIYIHTYGYIHPFRSSHGNRSKPGTLGFTSKLFVSWMFIPSFI